jgi:hypothetical protein
MDWIAMLVLNSHAALTSIHLIRVKSAPLNLAFMDEPSDLIMATSSRAKTAPDPSERSKVEEVVEVEVVDVVM